MSTDGQRADILSFEQKLSPELLGFSESSHPSKFYTGLDGKSGFWILSSGGFGLPQNVNELKNLDSASLLEILEKNLKQSWHPTCGASEGVSSITVTFLLPHDGKIKAVSIEKGSGITQVDKSLVRALKKISLVKPPLTSRPDIEMTLTFEFVEQDN